MIFYCQEKQYLSRRSTYYAHLFDGWTHKCLAQIISYIIKLYLYSWTSEFSVMFRLICKTISLNECSGKSDILKEDIIILLYRVLHFTVLLVHWAKTTNDQWHYKTEWRPCIIDPLVVLLPHLIFSMICLFIGAEKTIR